MGSNLWSKTEFFLTFYTVCGMTQIIVALQGETGCWLAKSKQFEMNLAKIYW